MEIRPDNYKEQLPRDARLEGVMIPGDRRLDHEREPLRQRVRRHRLVRVVRLAVLDVARAGRVHEGRVGGRDADEVCAEVLRHLLDVLRERLRVDDARLLRVDDALGRRICVRRQEVTLIGGVATVRGAHQRNPWPPSWCTSYSSPCRARRGCSWGAGRR